MPRNAQLLLSEADTVLMVVRGGLSLRSSKRERREISAGAVLLRSNGQRPLDRPIARALTLLQAEPAKSWTVESLAKAVGLSRAAFARRFVSVCGRSPLRYLTELRLALAASLLESSDESLAEVATRVGYASEFAFSRAFKRLHGVAPGIYRRLRAASHATHSPIRMAA